MRSGTGGWIVAAALWFGSGPQAAWAQSEVDILLNKLVDKGILSDVEAGQVRREMTETKEARNQQITKEIVPDSARNFTFKGDLRLRDEYRNRVGTGNDVNRQRIRFRYGFEAKVSDALKVNARFATGTSNDLGSTANGTNRDPLATNDSFDDFFLKKPFNLDLANIEYTPTVPGVSKITLIGGIMENPMWTVVPMVWDSDLSWDGAALNVSQEMGPVTLFTNGGVFSLDTDETEAAALWVIQGGASYRPFPDAEAEVLKNLKWTGALAYHDYANVVNPSNGTDPLTRESDNTTGAHDFNQLNPSVEVASQVAGYPVSLFGDWVSNLSMVNTPANPNGSEHNGFAFGLKVGKAKSPWSLKDGWEAGYFFERLEQDAAFDEFVDGDFAGGGTNRRGHVCWVTLATLKNSTLGAKYSTGHEIKGDKFRENRAQFDWMTKF